MWIRQMVVEIHTRLGGDASLAIDIAVGERFGFCQEPLIPLIHCLHTVDWYGYFDVTHLESVEWRRNLLFDATKLTALPSAISCGSC